MSPLKSALLSATLLLSAGGLAMAQMAQAGAQSEYDPAQLPATKGKVAQYTLTPRGDVDGLILTDGVEVHTNPGLSTELVFAVHPGDAVTIHGLKARSVPMIAGVEVTNDATGVSVQGAMGPGGRERPTPLEDQSKVKQVLHGPGGETNGVLLEDGTVVRMPPPEATKLASQLAVGQTLFVRGDGRASPLGKVIMARAIGPDSGNLTTIAAPPHPHGGMMAWLHGPHGPGPMGGPPAVAPK